MKLLRILFTWFPFLFICSTIANMIYLSVVSVVPAFGQLIISLPLHTLLFVITGFSLRSSRSTFDPEHFNALKAGVLFSVFFSIYLLRSPMYFPSHDDLAFHIPAAFYAQSPFFITTFSGIIEYKYAALDLNYTPFLATIGIRATLLLMGFLVSVWSVSLVFRYEKLFSKEIQFLIPLLYIFMYFSPELVGSHATFMTDVLSFMIFGEVFYLFFKLVTRSQISNASISFTLILTFVGLVTKQSSFVFFPFIIFLAIFFLWQVRRSQLTLDQRFRQLMPLVVLVSISSLYFIRTTLDSNLYLHHLENTNWGAFGPNNLLEAIFWSFIGPFTDRYSELSFAGYSKIFFAAMIGSCYFSHFVIVIYTLLSRKNILKSPTLFSLLVIITYLFWACFSGYGRYIAPLNFFAFLLLISHLETGKQLRVFVPRLAVHWLSIGVFIIMSFSAIKSDYSWRPFPSLRNAASTAYFITSYIQGAQLIFKDNIFQVADRYAPLWQNDQAIVTTRYGFNNFISFLAGIKGKTSLSNFLVIDIEQRLKNTTNIRVLNTLEKLQQTDQFLVVSDLGTQDLISQLYVSQNFNCSLFKRPIQHSPIQTDVLDTLLFFQCKRKIAGIPTPEPPLPIPVSHGSAPKLNVLEPSLSAPSSYSSIPKLDAAELVAEIENSQRVPCEGEDITEQLVGKGNIDLIRENVRQGRLPTVCIIPKYFVVHWVGKWIGAQSIKSSLEGNGLSCQLTTDHDRVWALMKFYSDRVERAACSGRNSNLVTLNNELNGVCFDQALAGKMVPDSIPDQSYADYHDDVNAICDHFAENKNEGADSRYSATNVSNRQAELLEITKSAVNNACVIRRQYHIPVQNFIGHFDIPQKYTIHPKFDPGQKYIEYFRQQLIQTCPIPEDAQNKIQES